MAANSKKPTNTLRNKIAASTESRCCVASSWGDSFSLLPGSNIWPVGDCDDDGRSVRVALRRRVVGMKLVQKTQSSLLTKRWRCNLRLSKECPREYSFRPLINLVIPIVNGGRHNHREMWGHPGSRCDNVINKVNLPLNARQSVHSHPDDWVSCYVRYRASSRPVQAIGKGGSGGAVLKNWTWSSVILPLYRPFPVFCLCTTDC